MDQLNHDEKMRVLFVDDEENVLRALNRLFIDEPIEIHTAGSGKEGLEVLKSREIAVIVSDQRMPEMDGAQFLEKAREMSPDSVRIVLTGYADISAAIDAINKGGAYRYIAKPWNNDDLLLTVRGAIQRYRLVKENKYLTELTIKQNEELQKWSTELEMYVQQQTIDLTRQNEELTGLNERLDKNLQASITSFSNLIELREKTVRNHSGNVATFSSEIARRLSLSNHEIEMISTAARLHDIGKIGVQDIILLKDPSALTDDEAVEYRKHPILGQSAINTVEGLREAGVLIRHHHESFDGSGFPDRLKADEIPLGSRIIAIADVFDRMAVIGSGNLPVSKALNVIELALKKLFDPGLFEYLREIAKDKKAAFVLSDGDTEIELPPNELLQGMVVSKDIRTGTGLMPLGKGVILDGKHIDIIQRCYHFDPAQTGVYVRIAKSALRGPEI